MELNQLIIEAVINEIYKHDQMIELVEVQDYHVLKTGLIVSVTANITDPQAFTHFLMQNFDKLGLKHEYPSQDELLDKLYEAMRMSPGKQMPTAQDGIQINPDSIETAMI